MLLIGDIFNVMVILSLEMESVTGFNILNDAVCIYFVLMPLRKAWAHLFQLWVGQTEFFILA